MQEYAAEQPGQTPEQTFAAIVIGCHSKNVVNLVQALTTHLAHARFPAFVLWSGLSGNQRGVIVIAWEGAVAEKFVSDLRRDFEIVDVVVYDWVKAHQERASKKSDGLDGWETPDASTQAFSAEVSG